MATYKNLRKVLNLPTLSASPSSGVNGEMYFNTTDSALYIYDGEWKKATQSAIINTYDIDLLIVAGGGGGGTSTGGGGGAGGLLVKTGVTVDPDVSGNYSITVGSGGAAAPGNLDAGTAGSNSGFSNQSGTLLAGAYGGGGGGSGRIGTYYGNAAEPDGESGGCGGGGSKGNQYSQDGASPTVGYGGGVVSRSGAYAGSIGNNGNRDLLAFQVLVVVALVQMVEVANPVGVVMVVLVLQIIIELAQT